MIVVLFEARSVMTKRRELWKPQCRFWRRQSVARVGEWEWDSRSWSPRQVHKKNRVRSNSVLWKWMEANLLHLHPLCQAKLFDCLSRCKILLETQVTSTESSQRFTLSLENHAVIKIILPFGSWNGGIYVSGKKCLLSLSRSSLNADASLKKFVRRMFFIAHNEPVIPWTYLICLDCLRSLQSPIAHPAHPQSLSWIAARVIAVESLVGCRSSAAISCVSLGSSGAFNRGSVRWGSRWRKARTTKSGYEHIESRLDG